MSLFRSWASVLGPNFVRTALRKSYVNFAHNTQWSPRKRGLVWNQHKVVWCMRQGRFPVKYSLEALLTKVTRDAIENASDWARSSLRRLSLLWFAREVKFLLIKIIVRMADVVNRRSM